MNVYLIIAGVLVLWVGGLLLGVSLMWAARRGDEALEHARRGSVDGPVEALRGMGADADCLWMAPPPRVHRRSGGGWVA